MTRTLYAVHARVRSATVLRERRQAARARALTDLLHRRPDLEGVHPAADLATEAIRWSA